MRLSGIARSSVATTWTRLAVAILIVAATVAVRVQWLHGLGNSVPYVSFFPAVIIAGLYGGLSAGILATVLSAIAASWWIDPVGRLLSYRRMEDMIGLAVFLLSGVMVSAVCEAIHRVRRRNAEAEAQLDVARERERAQAADERFGLLVRNSRDIILFVRHSDGRILDCNQAAEAAYGRTREDLLRLTIHDIRRTADRETVRRQLDQADSRGVLFETFHRRKDGTEFPVEVSSAGITLNGDRVILSVIRDITQRRVAEAALRESEERLRAVLDATKESIYVFSVDGIILLANRTAAERLGAEPEDIIGRDFRSLVPASLVESRAANLRKVAITGKPLQFQDERDGMVFIHTFYPMFHDDGSVENVAVFSLDVTERTRLEDERARVVVSLREAMAHEERLRAELEAVFTAQHDAVLIYDPDMVVVRANAAFMASYGFDPKGLSVTDISKRVNCRTMDGRPLDWNEQPTPRAVRGQLTRGLRYLVRAADGADVAIEASSGPMYLGGGIAGAVTVWHDITDQIRAEEALGRSERGYRRLIETANEGIWMVDSEGATTLANVKLGEILGCPPERIIGKSIFEFMHEEDVPQGRRNLARRRKGFREQLEFRLRAAGGRDVWVLASTSPIIDDEGNFAGSLGMLTDITDRKRMEESLRESEGRYRSLFNGMTEGFALHEIVCDADGKPCDYRFLDINPAFEKLTGLKRDEVIGRSLLEVIGLGEPEWIARYGEVALTGEPAHFDQFSPGLNRHYEVFAYRPAPRQFAVLFNDITVRISQAETLAQSNRAKDEFLAMLSHELRNPLGAISNATHILQSASPSGEPARTAIQLLQRQVEHTTHLINDLLDVSRINENKIDLRLEPVQIALVVRSAVDAVMAASDVSALNLILHLPDEPMWVVGDSTRLEQVLVNVLQNAVKYTSDGGKVNVELAREGEQAVIRVSDTGTGIPGDMLPYVFDLFRQGRTSPDRAGAGLGIGLTIARRLVEMHGGSISAHSEGTGRGTLITICLPLGRAPVPARVEVEADATGEHRRLTILVVDDLTDAAILLADVLREWGHVVSVAHDGNTALESIRTKRPNVVLLDLGLPGMSGLEVARCVRADPSLCDVRLVAVTGYGAADERRATEEAGFDCHLVKPVDLPSLARLLQTI